LLESGFHAVKAHLGCASPADETQRIAALRSIIGPQTPLMIDLNAGYTRSQAAEALRRWEEYRLFWLAEPLHPDDRQGLHELRTRSTIPLAAGENWFTAADFREPISAAAVHYLMPDAGRVGGLTELRRIALLAEATAAQVSPHNFSSGVLLAATLQVMATVPNARYLEMDNSGNAAYDDLLEEPIRPVGGMVKVPSYPGFGVCLPRNLVDRQATSHSFSVGHGS
jgi:L-alanine-DL-glutamate epimerase-like enolase superfamily enzyme